MAGLERRMPTGQSESVDRQADVRPRAGSPPSALVRAVRSPHRGGSTLVLDADGQNVIVVVADGGDPMLMWAFIKQHLSGRKAVRM